MLSGTVHVNSYGFVYYALDRNCAYVHGSPYLVIGIESTNGTVNIYADI